MAELYPLLLRPEFHERVWGARDLAPIYDKKAENDPIGEAWLTGDACRVANGPLAGKSLGELSKTFGARLVGEAATQKNRFPLLVKFLFPREKLSVQVHPDDQAARRAGEPCGKTECWYCLRAEPGAKVGLGLKPGTTHQQMEAAIQEKRAEHLLNWIEVNAGDMIYVDAGTVHAIGPGSILVETQQNSDTTYRLYDYGRPRDLHVQQGLEAMKPETHAGKVIQGSVGQGHMNLISASSFVIDKYEIEDTLTMGRGAKPGEKSSVRVLVALEGCAVVASEGSPDVTFARGDAVVVPASVGEFTVRPQWEIEFLCASLPGRDLPPPRTRMLS
jgi:mannose-6-phosphate isomerase